MTQEIPASPNLSPTQLEILRVCAWLEQQVEQDRIVAIQLVAIGHQKESGEREMQAHMHGAEVVGVVSMAGAVKLLDAILTSALIKMCKS